MSEPRALVEHFFRHEFGRLCAVLTRSLGVRRLALVEDVVQAALVQALETWSRRGVPEDPAGWLYRTARNLAIDALRRERTHAQALPRLAADAERKSSPLEAHFADEIGDEPLRLLFVCCHESVPAPAAIDLRLREAAQLHRLGMSLQGARRIGPVEGRSLAADALDSHPTAEDGTRGCRRI